MNADLILELVVFGVIGLCALILSFSLLWT